MRLLSKTRRDFSEGNIFWVWKKMDNGRREESDIEIEGGGVNYNDNNNNEMKKCEGFGSELSDDHGSGMLTTPLLLKNRTNTTSQIAIVGANICPIESLDYDIIENELFKQDWRTRRKVEIFQYIFLKWMLALLIGVLTGIVAFFNNFVVENIAGCKLLLISNLMLKNRYFLGFVANAWINLGLAISAAILCAYIAPAAAGSGIPEVKAYLNGVDAHSILAPTTLFVKEHAAHFGNLSTAEPPH